MNLNAINNSTVPSFPIATFSTPMENFINLKRLRLANLSTPIERADRLRKLIPGGPEIFIKRDDLTGYFGGGNKLRKLEYVMADALAQGATTVITNGSITSNLARTTALVARRLGLKCVLVLNGGDPKSARANSRLAELLDVKVYGVSSRQERDEKMNEVAESLEREGEVVYKIPLGASNDVGSFGMVAAMEELSLQQLELGTQFDAVVLATSSGGTQAGLEVAKRLFGYEHLRVIGISADDPSNEIKAAALKAIVPMLKKLSLPSFVSADELTVDDSFTGPGYGIPTNESKEAMELFSKAEGLLLDPVYSCKGAAGLIAYCRRGEFKKTDRVLFCTQED
jgi:1-aminocyclopropane-1-carboxylate deaminase/D-cysteine desulfhydrase-like pyridoxal-dependent ACC family enzyme